jgi:uncharacterized protein (DUF2141 family)
MDIHGQMSRFKFQCHHAIRRVRSKRIGLFLALLCIPLWGTCRTLEVEITGVRNAKGQIKVGVYTEEGTFPEAGSEFKGIDVSPVKKGANVAVFELPEGTYAVAIIHDENKNGKLDQNFLGIPKEGYGFSNDARATFGSPSFDAAAFSLTNSVEKISIEMKY